MNLGIDYIKATINKNPLLDPTKFSVSIVGPAGLATMPRDIQTLCNAATLPGRGFGTVERYNHGPIRKIPYSELYDDVSTTFYLDQYLTSYNYFNAWQELIGGKETYDIAYYNDFIGSVIISTEDKTQSVINRYELFEAYPINITPIEMAFDKTDVVEVFTVTWAFHHFERKVTRA